MAERKDHWTDHDDSVLAKITLKHIRDGSTQLQAFEEAAEVLNRTAAACGFRWNSEVRKHYAKEIAEAKYQRRILPKHKALISNAETDDVFTVDPLDRIIEMAKNYKQTVIKLTKQVKELTVTLRQRDNQLEALQKRLEASEIQPEEYNVTEDYQALLGILERARRLGVTAEERASAVFKMDQNGNLNKIG